MSTFQIISPATGKVFASYDEQSIDKTIAIIESCQQAYLKHRPISFAERAEKMRNAAIILRKNKHQYAELMANEMGKPVTAGVAEIEKCAWVCEHYAEHAADYLAPRQIKTEMQKSFVSYQPRGIVFAIMPWNYPFWQVFRFAAPCLMAGNAALLKHAPISTGTGLAIEAIFKQAEFTDNVFRTLIIDNNVAAQVIQHPLITAVTLTGSERAGKVVGALAAGALKKVVLELGGSDPYVILEDANLEKAAEAIVVSRMNNSGQVCIAAKRVIVVKPVRDTLQKLIMEKVQRYQMGDPLNQQTNFGPMAREDLRAELHKQVEQSIAAGAKCEIGGKVPAMPGFYYPPTVLSNVKKGMPAYDQELFGPVIVFIDAKDEKEAIQIANDSAYGLGGAVFTEDLVKGERIATHEIQVGACFVNTFVASDPRLPFGGIKNSGYGRELSAEGIREFVNTKTVAIK